MLHCDRTDYDRYFWTNPSWGHWLPAGSGFLGFTALLLLELGIIKSNNYRTTTDIKTQSKLQKRKSVEENEISSDTNSDEETRMNVGPALENDELVLSRPLSSKSRAGLNRLKSLASQAWIALGFENFVLVVTGLGKFGTLIQCATASNTPLGLVIAHVPTGNIAWGDDFNLMHLLFGAIMLVMGLVGAMFNTHFLSKITFNFIVALTLILLGLMMSHHDQEAGLVAFVHKCFTYGTIRSDVQRF